MTKKKYKNVRTVFVLTIGISGNGYTSDEPIIIGVYEDKENALKDMEEAYKLYAEPGEKETNREEDYIEETNMEFDHHFIIQIHERALL